MEWGRGWGSDKSLFKFSFKLNAKDDTGTSVNCQYDRFHSVVKKKIIHMCTSVIW